MRDLSEMDLKEKKVKGKKNFISKIAEKNLSEQNYSTFFFVCAYKS